MPVACSEVTATQQRSVRAHSQALQLLRLPSALLSYIEITTLITTGKDLQEALEPSGCPLSGPSSYDFATCDGYHAVPP
ncbi:hypothetical protein PAL_GLEAN10011239 [Pteropus alecto]|uniref:Uncharacterized protein n=1 Tax=Pteropus alecto TaxID=9402 RepID=L5KPW8_PTEAL|nr:hypothetical protein PAL_GLEAN10011239 [Pteropus alecto]